MTRPIAVTLLGRPGCHLCEDGRELLERIRDRLGGAAAFTIEEVDIEGDDELFKRHLERIPVVLIDGEEVDHLELDERRIVQRLVYLQSR